MKNFTFTYLVLLMLCSENTIAQNNSMGRSNISKPFLFKNLPDDIACTAIQLSSFFTINENQNLKILFINTLKIEGTVKKNIIKTDQLQTVIINLPAFNNIDFHLSKRKDQNNNVVYVGHLFDMAYSDGYELKKINQENYHFVKISMDKILPYCAQ